MERELARLIIEQRRILQNIEAIYSEVVLLERAILERQSALVSLREYKDSKEECESLVPLGGNIYLPSKLIPGKQALVGVGANIYISKSIDDAIMYVDKAINQLNQLYQNRVSLLNELRKKYDELTALISELRMKTERRGTK